jgi:hypothetical protein
MGLAVDGSQLAIGGVYPIWELWNVPAVPVKARLTLCYDHLARSAREFA